MQFSPFWTAVARASVEDLSKSLGISCFAEKVLNAIGLHDGAVEENGILCAGTYSQIADVINGVLAENKMQATVCGQEVSDCFADHADCGKVVATCDELPALLSKLQQMGKKLFLVTTDVPKITRACLQKLGIFENFEKIFCDDGTHANKPNPQIICEIMRDCGLSCHNLCMVGDTLTDVNFAKNGNIAFICVGNEETKNQSDYAIDNVSQLIDLLQ